MSPQTWQYKDFKMTGVSLAGIYSCYHLPDFNLTVDVAQGFDWCLNDHLFFITHGHMDHAAGIPYIIAQKNMRHHPMPTFFMPQSLIAPMKQIVSLWSQIERFDYQYQFLAIEDHPQVALRPGYKLKSFKTIHRIDSFGYSLVKTQKSLKKEFQNFPGQKLAELKNKGIVIEEEKEKILISFSGDTQIEFLDEHPELLNSEILFLESTFIDDKKSIADAKKWGHIHLMEIIERLPRIKSEKILLKHLSSRYSQSRSNGLLDQLIGPSDRHRFEVFPGR